MKQNPSQSEPQSRLLILSDDKPGHVNQSIAFAKHLELDYDLCRVRLKSRFAKGFSYLADRCGLLLESLFQVEPFGENYRAVVSAGSETYYANRLLAKRLGAKSVAIMLPKGYRYDFDLIVAQQHDDPPQRENIISLPINLTYAEPQGVVTPEEGKKYVALIIGGDSRHGKLDAATLRNQLRQIFNLFPQHDFWLTTSRRTPTETEAVLREFTFARAVYYSQEQINPIPDYLQHAEYVFLTSDSTSMISEAVSFGSSCVEVLPFQCAENNDKFTSFIQNLLGRNCVHIFDGQVGTARQKINLGSEVQKIYPRFVGCESISV